MKLNKFTGSEDQVNSWNTVSE